MARNSAHSRSWAAGTHRSRRLLSSTVTTKWEAPGSHIYRAGSATLDAGTVLRDREVLQHVRRNVAIGLPASAHPEQGPPAIAAALELADATAMACRIVGRSPSGTAIDRDAAVGAFVLVADNLDMAVENLAPRVPTPYSAWLAAAQTGLEQAYTHLREAVICSAVDFRQPGNGSKSWPCNPIRSPSSGAFSRCWLSGDLRRC